MYPLITIIPSKIGFIESDAPHLALMALVCTVLYSVPAPSLYRHGDALATHCPCHTHQPQSDPSFVSVVASANFGSSSRPAITSGCSSAPGLRHRDVPENRLHTTLLASALHLRGGNQQVHTLGFSAWGPLLLRCFLDLIPSQYLVVILVASQERELEVSSLLTVYPHVSRPHTHILTSSAFFSSTFGTIPMMPRDLDSR